MLIKHIDWYADLPIDGTSRSDGEGLSKHWLLLTWRMVKVCKKKVVL